MKATKSKHFDVAIAFNWTGVTLITLVFLFFLIAPGVPLWIRLICAMAIVGANWLFRFLRQDYRRDMARFSGA